MSYILSLSLAWEWREREKERETFQLVILYLPLFTQIITNRSQLTFTLVMIRNRA
jgi:hypothetical protein